MAHLRPLRGDDAAPLARLYVANRAFLAPFEPDRPDVFFTEQGQRERIDDMRVQRELDTAYSFAIEQGDELVGTVSLTNVVRGPRRSASLGYWVAEQWNDRGIATSAVGQAVELAFGEIELHRLQAGTLVDNVASQRVLLKNGFERIGVARHYLRIAGAWRDHILFQRTAD